MRLLILFFVFSFISCKNDNQNIFFGGKILNKSADKIILNKDDNIISESLIDENGFFQMKLDSINSGLYNFFLQPEFQYVILEKNDSIYIRLNSLDFDESLVFMGNGASKNNFLMDVFLSFEKNEDILNKSFNESFGNYLKKVDSVLSVQEKKFIEFKNEIKSKLFRFLAFEVLLKNTSISEKSIFIDEFLKISTFKSINDEVDELYENQKKITPGNDFPLVYFANQNGSIVDITGEKKSKKVLFFWSYDQNSHLNAIHQKILKLKTTYSNYKFYSININDSQSKWLDNIISNDVVNIRSVNFDEMSKKLIIDNLNKIFFLSEENKIQKIDLIDNLILN